jgi:alpha-beta hydrolase superfamily lysophospholipase
LPVLEREQRTPPRADGEWWPRISPKRLLWALAVLLLIAVAALAAVGGVGSQRALYAQAGPPKRTLADYTFRVEDVRFPSRDGVPLVAWFVKGSRPETLIVPHGFPGSKQHELEHIDMLHRAGFNVLALDLRSSPTGGGAPYTFGYYERWDVAGAADYLVTRPDVDPTRIGGFGRSMGAASILLGAPETGAIRAIVAEGSYKSLDSVVAAGFEYYLDLPPFPFAPATVLLAEWRAGIRASEIRPINAVPRLAGRPILFIAGLDAWETPYQDTIEMFKVAGEPRQLWLIPGARHSDGLTVAPQEYAARVASFFDAALNGRPLPSVASAETAR